MRAFAMNREFAASNGALAANQGLDNSSLAAGLFSGLWVGIGWFAMTTCRWVRVAAANAGRKILLAPATSVAVSRVLLYVR